MRRHLLRSFCTAAMLSLTVAAGAEPGGPAEIGTGVELRRDEPAWLRAERSRLWREHVSRQRAERDSIAAAGRSSGGAVQHALEAAKRRHATEDLRFQLAMARRAGQARLVRQLEARLAGASAADVRAVAR